MTDKNKRVIILLLLLIIPIFLLRFTPMGGAIKKIYIAIVNPVIRGVSYCLDPIHSYFKRVVISKELIINNFELKKENDQLKTDLLYYKELESENQRLYEILDLKKSLKTTTIAAQVIGNDLSAWRKSIVINKGKKHGVKKDLPVISSYGLVGRVVEVGNTLSRVMLLTDVEFKISALAAYSREEGIIEGTGGPRCIMNYISKDAFVNKNDIVISSGLGGIFPKGIIIGAVADVDVVEDSLFKKIEITPSVNFAKLEEVLVIIPEKDFELQNTWEFS